MDFEIVVASTGLVTFCLLLVLVGLKIVRGLFGIRSEIVPQEERVVIYRRGKFHRLAGPGRVVLVEQLPVWPTFELATYESVEKTINVRNEPGTFFVDNIYLYGIPFGYTINFWQYTDLEAAANSDRGTLASLAQFNNQERYEQTLIKVRQALIDSANLIQKRYPLQGQSTYIERLLPLFPGLPQCAEMLESFQKELAKTLPSVGVFVNQEHPFIITNVHFAPDIVDSFTRERTLKLLQNSLPDLSKETMVMMLSAIEGIDMPRIYQLLFDAVEPSEQAFDVPARENHTTDSRIRQLRPQSGSERKYTQHNSLEKALEKQKYAFADAVDLIREQELSILKAAPPVS